MIAILFLFVLLFHGIVIANTISKTNTQVKLAGGFLLGSLLSGSFVYWVACLFHSLDLALVLFFFFSIQLVLIFKNQYMQAILLWKSLTKIDWAVGLVLFAFSYYLFAKTFGYDSAHGTFLIATNVYLDFGAHIPFIRSFSMGNNFPGEVPFFQNTGLVYYFLFDFFTGIFEHLGLRIDIAYNVLSSISLTALLVLIYQLAITIFQKKSIGIISVIFFLFSSNLSFLNFLQRNGFSLHEITAWWHNAFYLEGTPTFLDKNISIAGFWNLNPYMNQRHLVFGAAFLLYFVYTFVSQKKLNKTLWAFLGISLGFLVMWHTMVFLAIYMVSLGLFFFYPHLRRQLIAILFIGGLIGIPQLYGIKLHSANTILFIPGFLLEHMLTLRNEVIFWFSNLGLALIAIPLGFLFANKQQRNFFLVFLPLFIIPNLIHFSSRFTFDDHKYFNLWIIFAGMFSAFFLVKLFTKNLFLRPIAVILFIFLILSGAISIMVIKNDMYAPVPDYPKNALLQYLKKNIPSQSIVLTNGEIYDSITLVGRKTLVGRTEYIFVYGGTAGPRLEVQKNLLQPTSEEDMISEVHKNKIQYIVLYKNGFAKNEKQYDNSLYLKHFIKLYETPDGIVYKI